MARVLVYLEFLTGQLPTAAGLLFPTAYLIARTRPEPDNHPRQAWRFALAGVTAFALGAVFTVVINQALAVAIVGPEAVRSFAEYLHRYVNPNPAASLSHFHETWATPGDPLIWSTLKSFYVVLGEGYVLTYGSRPPHSPCMPPLVSHGWPARSSRFAAQCDGPGAISSPARREPLSSYSGPGRSRPTPRSTSSGWSGCCSSPSHSPGVASPGS